MKHNKYIKECIKTHQIYEGMYETHQIYQGMYETHQIYKRMYETHRTLNIRPPTGRMVLKWGQGAIFEINQGFSPWRWLLNL